MPMQYPYYNPQYSPYISPYNASAVQPTNLPTANPTSANNGIIWVQGETGAKSYLVGAGNTVLLMDSEQSRFYIKATDNSGMPMPLRTFEYSEITAENGVKTPMQSNAVNDYVTHEELERRLKELEPKTTTKKEAKSDGKSAV